MDKKCSGHLPRYGPRGRCTRDRFRRKASSRRRTMRPRRSRCAGRRRSCLARSCKRNWGQRFCGWPRSGFSDDRNNDSNDNKNENNDNEKDYGDNNRCPGLARLRLLSRRLPALFRSSLRNQKTRLFFRHYPPGGLGPLTTMRKSNFLGPATTSITMMMMMAARRVMKARNPIPNHRLKTMNQP